VPVGRGLAGEKMPVTFGAAYLRDAEHWFDVASIGPCGEEEEIILAAGRAYRCLGLSPRQARLLKSRYESGGVSSIPMAELQFRTAPADVFLPMGPSITEYTFDQECRRDEVMLAGWDFAARIVLRPRFAATMWTPHLGGEMFESAFANVFRVIVAYAVLESGGALLHSAAVAEKGSARLFVGVSGAGKSTISQLALDSGRSVLSDDLNALWRLDGETYVEQVPFTGDLRGDLTTSGRFPLEGIFRLRQGTTARLRPLRDVETVALLYGCAPFVNSDPFRRERLLENLELSATDLPAEELTFRLDGGFWHLVFPGKAS
jgi:hypothetical protein